MVDKIINLAKNKNTRRLLQTYLTNKELQQRLIEEIVPKVQNRVSGYTTQIKMGVQHGDKTTMVRMSIIGNEKLKPLVNITRNKKQDTITKIEKDQVKNTKEKVATQSSIIKSVKVIKTVKTAAKKKVVKKAK